MIVACSNMIETNTDTDTNTDTFNNMQLPNVG